MFILIFEEKRSPSTELDLRVTLTQQRQGSLQYVSYWRFIRWLSVCRGASVSAAAPEEKEHVVNSQDSTRREVKVANDEVVNYSTGTPRMVSFEIWVGLVA